MPRTWEKATLWAIWDGTDFVARTLSLADGLSTRGERAILVPEEYVAGGIDSKAAAAIAERELSRLVADRIQQSLTPLKFASMELTGGTPLWWSFRRVCREWQEEGLVPGAVSCSVDRLDGHLWSAQEMESFWRNQNKA